MKRDLAPIIKQIRGDSRYQRLLKNFQELPVYQLEVSKLSEEINRIHKVRSSRYLDQNKPEIIRDIVGAGLNDSAQRSRLCEIEMQCAQCADSLEDATKALTEYLIIAYGQAMGSVRTKDERLQLMRIALKPFLSFIKEVNLVRDLAKIVISDIDKTYWYLQLTLNSYEIRHRPERNM